MENRFMKGTPRPGQARQSSANAADEIGVAVLTELTEAELRAVAGGLNPQPLPPGRRSLAF